MNKAAHFDCHKFGVCKRNPDLIEKVQALDNQDLHFYT